MGLLDGGIQAVFGAAFSGIYLDGMFHRVTLTDNGVGGMTESIADVPIKYQRDEMSAGYRAQFNIPVEDVRVLILQTTLSGKPTTDDKFSIDDGTYVVSDADADPANSYWRVRGSPAAPVET